MKKQLRNLTTYLAPAMLTLFCGIAILAVQNIWPFGGQTVDFYDMGQQVAAEYIQIYDELHLSKSPFFDWYLMAGHGIPGGTYFSVLNLFMYFMPRDMILEFFSVFLLIKIMLMAVSMRVCIHHEASECPDFYACILSAGYGLCGYVLLMYTIIAWLDIAILVPLIVMFAHKVLSEGRIIGFVICTSMAFMLGFYVPVMVLIFAFLSAGLYLVIRTVLRRLSDKADTESKGADGRDRLYVLRLGIAVLISLGLSAFVWLPDLIQASGSMRFNIDGNNSIIGQYLGIVTHVRPDYATRLWAFLGISFAAAVVFAGLIRDIRRKNIKRLLLVAGNIIIVCAGYVFESIQLFWCFGSYVNYPARNGFLIYIVFALAAAMYIPEIIGASDDELPAERRIAKVRVYSRGRMTGYEDEIKIGLNIWIGAGLILSLLLCAGALFWYQLGTERSIYDVFRMTILCMAGCFVIYLLLILIRSGRLAKLSVFIMCAELIIYGTFLIGEPNYYTGYTEGAEQESEYIRISNQLKNGLGIEPSYLDRVKNPDNSLNSNYGRFLERGTIAGWLPSTSSKTISGAAALGYTTQFTRVLSSGGNVFTDALLHMTQSISSVPQDKNLYRQTASKRVVVDSQTGQKDEYSLYDCRYRLPFGTVIASENQLQNVLSAAPGVDWYNAVYDAVYPDYGNESGSVSSALSDDEEASCDDFAEVLDKTADGKDINYAGVNNEIAIDGYKALYFRTSSVDADCENMEIIVNGDIIPVPTIKNASNTRFPTQFNNNCLYLGSFKNETVTVRVDTDASIEAPTFDCKLYTVDLNKLSGLCNAYAEISEDMIFTAGKRTLSADIANAEDGSYLMLPIEYDAGWSAKVNGENAEPVYVNGLFMAVPLVGGDNKVRLSYSPVMFNIGIALGILTILLCAVWEIIVGSSTKLQNNTRMLFANVAKKAFGIEDRLSVFIENAYFIMWALVIVGMYIVPAVYGVWYYISILI